MQYLKNLNPTNILFFSLIILGLYFCYVGGYGSDEDTLPMLGTFSNFLDGNFMTSRFTGYPVAEFILGFLAYFFGSFVVNIFTFFAFLIAIVFFFITLEEKTKLQINKIFFLSILILSNPILYFDNLEPMDYSWAFLFFSLGCFFYVKNQTELACLLFGICIGTRINFAPFILSAIFFLNGSLNENKKKKIIISFCSIFTGCLFYLPVWIYSGLTLDWLTAGRPSGNFNEIFARFSYKTFLSLGYFQSLVIFFVVVIFRKKILNTKNFKFLLSIIFFNLLIFLWIPAELSYLQPMLICIYLLLFMSLDKRVIIFIIFLNFFNWYTYFDPIKITHKSVEKCAPKVAISANINLHFEPGYFIKFIESRDMIRCWINPDSSYGKKVLAGKALK